MSSPEERLLAVCAALDIPVEDRGVSGAGHAEPTWNGCTLRWPLRDIPNAVHWLAHEVGHYFRAPAAWRAVPNYGFVRDPHSEWSAHAGERIRPEFDPDDDAWRAGADDEEEAEALWLGVLIGEACGLDPADAVDALGVINEDWEMQAEAMQRLAAAGAVVPAPPSDVFGPWTLAPGVIGGAW